MVSFLNHLKDEEEAFILSRKDVATHISRKLFLNMHDTDRAALIPISGSLPLLSFLVS